MNYIDFIIAYFLTKKDTILPYIKEVCITSDEVKIIDYISKNKPNTIERVLQSKELKNPNTSSLINTILKEYKLQEQLSFDKKNIYIQQTLTELINQLQLKQILTLAKKEELSPEERVKRITNVTEIIRENILGNNTKSYTEFSKTTIDEIFDKIVEGVEFVPIGLDVLDDNLGGIPKKSFVTFLAPTGGGKTTLLCYLTGQLLKRGKNIVYISFEEDKNQILYYIIQSMLGVSKDEIKNNPEKNKKQIKNILENCGTLYINDYIVDPSNIFDNKFKNFSSKALHSPYDFVEEFYNLDIDYMFVDYLGSMMNSGLFEGKTSYELGDSASRFLKKVAKELNIPVISAQQLNREGIELILKGKIEDVDIAKVSGSSAIAFWADALFVVYANMNNKEVKIYTLKLRFHSPVSVTSKIDFETKTFNTKSLNKMDMF